MATLIKICGINSAEAADAAASGAVDFAGLMFHPKSPRHVTAEAARALAQRLRGRVRIVAVAVDPRDEEIVHVVNNVVPDFLQLHGSESPARVSEIRARFGIPVIKVLPIGDVSDFANLKSYEEIADILMFDAKPPANADRAGGHGVAFDWQLLRSRAISRPWLLAGGLTPENVARAITASNAPGVDVSSGVETSLGVKDPEMILSFIASVRSAHATGAAA